MENQEDKEVRLTLRMDRNLYDRIVKRAAQNKPAAKINPTIVYLLELALELEKSEKSSGNWSPVLPASLAA